MERSTPFSTRFSAPKKIEKIEKIKVDITSTICHHRSMEISITRTRPATHANFLPVTTAERKEYMRSYYHQNRDRIRKQKEGRRVGLLKAYGEKCKCCGEDNWSFLGQFKGRIKCMNCVHAERFGRTCPHKNAKL